MNTILSKIFNSKALYCIAIIGFMLSHIPFLSADADISIATGSRGAWTDEGLNTCQIRNFVTHHHFHLLDCDNFLKTPLFSVFLYPFFKLLGISMAGARLITVMFIAALLLSFLKTKTIKLGLFFIISTLLFFPIHQYSHLCLAEMYASMIIVIALLLFSFSSNIKKRYGLILIYLLLCAAVLYKIQFAYILIIPLLYTALRFWKERSETNKIQVFCAVCCFVVILIGMSLIWYLPFKKEWMKISEIHASHFSLQNISMNSIWHKVKDNFLSQQLVVYTSFFLLSLILSVKQLFDKNNQTNDYKNLLTLSILWVLIELHKLGYSHLPMRYLISFYMSMGLFTSIVLGNHLTSLKKQQKYIANLSLLFLFSYNFYYYIQAYSNRTYVLRDLNFYVKSMTADEDVLIGTWAPAISWETRCSTFPIWTDYLHGRDILLHYCPNFIIYEDEEMESGYAYKNNGIILDSIGIPLKKSRVALWNINILKVKNKIVYQHQQLR